MKGRIRELVHTHIDIKAEVLCNGTDLKFARTDFKNGDDLYLYFQTPVDGYLAVYLFDEVTQMVYCLLPYKNSTESVFQVKKDIPYVFFSAKHGLVNNDLIDEYTMTCNKPIEHNTLYIIFSPNKFFGANSMNVNEKLPQVLTFKDFRKWQISSMNKDKEFVTVLKSIVVQQ